MSMRISNPGDATRYDPYGEMGHIIALPIGEAVEAYVKAVEYKGSIGRITGYPGGKGAWAAEAERRDILLKEAAHCVLLSGFAARGEQ